MPPPLSKNQMSIKEMLQARTDQFKKDDIIIPEIFNEYIDTRAYPATDGEDYMPTYLVSLFARVWFREHSNFEDVLRDYWASNQRRQSHPYEYHATKIIRMVTTIPINQLEFPMNTFRFKSIRDEAIARMLLMHPGIKEEDDLQELLTFHNRHKLQLSTVLLSLDNNVHADGLAYVREKQRSQNTKVLPVYTRQNLSYYIRRQYYKRNGLTKDIYLVDLTVAELEEISRFKTVVLRLMSTENYQEKQYEKYSDIYLDLFKTDTELLLEQKDFAVKDPIVNLICNVMTIEQQTEAATDMESFYQCTNAKKECRKLRDGTTWKEFFDLYCRRNDHEKKLVPFHRLYYMEKGSADPLVTTTGKVTEVQFQSRVRFESNNRSPPPIESIDGSSEASNDTVRPPGPSKAATMKEVIPVKDVPAELPAKVVQETSRVPQPQKPSRELAGTTTKALQNLIKDELALPSTSNSIPPMTQPTQDLPAPQLRLPKLFLELTTPTDETLQLATIMCPNRRFVSEVKHELGVTYQLNFATLWKENKQSILVAYINELWDKDWAKLKVLVEKWPTEIEAKKLKLILMRRESQRSESTESSFTTAASEETSDQAHPIHQQSSNNDVELGSGEVPLPGIIPIIKQEPHTLQMNYTDVECLGTLVENEIVINDSLEFEDSLVKELQEENETVNPFLNPFLNEINGGPSVAIITTQESQDSNPNHYSDETLKRFEAFVPMSVHQKIADNKAKTQSVLKENNKPSTSAETKRKSNPTSKQSRAKKSRPANLQYLDDEESLEMDGNESPSCLLQQTTTDDFSVFLSPEIINAVRYVSDDIGAGVNHLNPFTYARATTDGSELPTDTSCFIVNLNRVVYEKNVKFDLFVNLPQYTLYNLVISGDSVRDLLSISDGEFKSLLNLLSFVRKYEFTAGSSRPRPSKLGHHTARQLIIQQIDLFFSSQIKFKSFSLNIYGDQFSCYGGNHSTNYNMNLTSALDPETLKALRRCQIANKLSS